MTEVDELSRHSVRAADHSHRGVRNATAIGLGGVAVSVLLIALMHVLGPAAAISPIDRTISEYGLTSSGWVFELAVLILAAASAALFTARMVHLRMRLRSWAGLFASLWSAGLVTLVLFPKAAYSAVDGTGGDVHRIASLIAFVSLPIAVLSVGRAAAADRRWARYLGVASLAWFLPMVAAMVYGAVIDQAWWVVVPLGLIERAMAGTEIAALVVLARPSLSKSLAIN